MTQLVEIEPSSRGPVPLAASPAPSDPAAASLPPILQIVGDGAAGGGTTVVLQLAEELAARTARVTVASQADSYLLGRAAASGVATFPLDFTARGNTFSLARAIGRYLDAHPGTVVHAHGARAALAVALLPAKRRPPLFYTVHGFHYAKKPPGLRHLAMLAERFCIGRATATVFVSAHDAKVAAAHRLVPRSARTRIVYNGAVHAEPATAASAFDLAFLGRLHSQKNPGLLVDILAALRPLRPSLAVIGGGHLEGELRARVDAAGLAGQVTFLGERAHADALRLLATAKLMILPSRWEGLPVSVIEAMHRAIPVVASDIPGTRELVEDGETGFLVPPSDATAYADRVARLLGDDALRATIGRKALARARASFSIDTQMQAYLGLYAGAVAP